MKGSFFLERTSWDSRLKWVKTPYMQWAAVRTQQDDSRIPPHMWPKPNLEFLGLDWRDTCQGWEPG